MKTTDFTVRYKDDDKRPADLKHVGRLLVDGWSELKDEDITIVVIQGGITNLLYRLDHGSDSALVRVFGAKTELMIDREVDNRVFQGLSDRGFGPFLHGVFTNGRVEGWVNGSPLEPSEMGQTEPLNLQALIAVDLGRMHSLDMPGDRSPMLWSNLTKWFDMANEVAFDGGRLAEGLASLNRTKLRREMNWAQTVLPSPLNSNGTDLASDPDADPRVGLFLDTVAFCHNDLLSGNILKLNDADKLQFLDFEYGGFNYRGFDLANHFCEYAGFDFDLDKWYPKKDAQIAFLKSYVPTVEGAGFLPSIGDEAAQTAFLTALHTRINEFALASHFFWGLWAIIQARYSPIDFDFMGYALQRFGGYYKHKRTFFPDAFTESDERAESIIQAQIGENDRQLAAETKAKATSSEAGAGAGAGAGADAEPSAEAIAKCPHLSKMAAEGKVRTDAGKGKCPLGHGAKADSGKADEGSSGGKCPVHGMGKWIGLAAAVAVVGVVALVVMKRR